jgi:hypothetical protein
MPSDPVIVPPPPAIAQPSGPVDNSPGIEQLQKAFDRVAPAIKGTPAAAKPEAPPAPPEPQPPAPEPVPPPAKEEKLPSFLEEALKAEPSQVPKPAPEPAVDDFSDELPPEERKSRIKGLRDAYKNLKEEVKTLKATPHRDPQEQQRLQWLEQQNRQMAEVLSRVGVEHSAEFQQQIMAPLTASWHEAARIVRDSGGDPQELAKAMSLNGRAQFEALDNLFVDMPESAKAEAHDALRMYRRYEQARQAAVQNAPQTLEQIRTRETERQYAELNKQREGMKHMFENALARLRDEAKVEVFQTTTDPQGKWWNEQQEALVRQGRELFLENTDLDKVAMACLLAPTADAYRKLFLKSQKKIIELQKVIDERIGSEPTLSESGGNSFTAESQIQDDLKKPFSQVFLREFHRAQQRNR